MKRFLLLLLISVFSLYGIQTVSVNHVNTPRVWTTEDSKNYAKDSLVAWQEHQWECLDKLWTKESNWRHKAYNKVKVMGKNAGGIPQILGLDPNTNPPTQIDRGLAYITHRYGTPCMAWKYWQKHGWY